MDIEKLIEQLNGYFEGKDLKRFVALDAATALSTLQAENEKLRAELEQVKRELSAYKELGPIDRLRELKQADVAEVKHGRWITEICESISKRNRLIEYKVYSCSACGRSNGRVKKRYCPNCGALMREDEHEAD